MSPENTKKILDDIQEFLLKLAEGNFETKLELQENQDEQVIGVQTGINMLVEELQATTISKQYLNSIYNSINDILIVCDSKGMIKEINENGAKLLGYKTASVIGKPIENIIHIENINSFQKTIDEISIKKQPKEIAINFKNKTNSTIPTSCSISYLFDKNKTDAFLVLAKDLRILLDAQKQLANKNDELNLFVYKASHDLKSPVSSMLGLLDLASKSNNIDELKKYLEFLNQSSQKLQSIINDLLVIGQVTYVKIDIKPIDISKEFNILFKEYNFFENSKNIKLSFDSTNAPQFINSELSLFKAIFSNLIENSIKYSKETQHNPTINIVCKKHINGVLITIKDNGIGIDKKDQENIFKIFYRATTSSSGSGLGLYIVSLSVQKLEGTISIDSELNVGSTFNIYIPSL